MNRRSIFLWDRTILLSICQVRVGWMDKLYLGTHEIRMLSAGNRLTCNGRAMERGRYSLHLAYLVAVVYPFSAFGTVVMSNPRDSIGLVFEFMRYRPAIFFILSLPQEGQMVMFIVVFSVIGRA